MFEKQQLTKAQATITEDKVIDSLCHGRVCEEFARQTAENIRIEAPETG